MKKIVSCCIALWLLLALAACGPQEKTLADADRAAVLTFSEPATDNLFASIATNDYALFTRDFDADMLKAFPADKFTEMQQSLGGKVGNYISREVVSVTQLGDFYRVTYNAKFERDDPVTVLVVFRAADPHNVSGLWFDSVKLREK